MAKGPKVPKKRRLTDLYKVGKTVKFNDDGDDSEAVEVYLAKVNDLEQKKCVERASAERAKFLLLERDKNHPDRAQYLDQLDSLGFLKEKDALIGIIIGQKMSEEEASIEARLAHDEESWGKNNLLDSLREAWDGGMSEEIRKEGEGGDEASADAKRIYEELKRFDAEVQAEVDEIRENMMDAYRQRPQEELITLATDRLIEIEGSNAWVEEFMRWRLFYGVRDPENHSERYFENRQELDDLEPKIFKRLRDEYESMVIGGAEGKD